jgi:hypothetical protein
MPEPKDINRTGSIFITQFIIPHNYPPAVHREEQIRQAVPQAVDTSKAARPRLRVAAPLEQLHEGLRMRERHGAGPSRAQHLSSIGVVVLTKQAYRGY